MFSRRHFGEAAQRFAERRQRENEAVRLREQVPHLDSLRLEIKEHRDGGIAADGAHIRRIVVEHAPALFVLPCGDPSCKDGGHDVTHSIVRALTQGTTKFEGENACQGYVGSANCSRVLHFVAFATYRRAP
jgi:hypothetical protein